MGSESVKVSTVPLNSWPATTSMGGAGSWTGAATALQPTVPSRATAKVSPARARGGADFLEGLYVRMLALRLGNFGNPRIWQCARCREAGCHMVVATPVPVYVTTVKQSDQVLTINR